MCIYVYMSLILIPTRAAALSFRKTSLVITTCAHALRLLQAPLCRHEAQLGCPAQAVIAGACTSGEALQRLTRARRARGPATSVGVSEDIAQYLAASAATPSPAWVITASRYMHARHPRQSHPHKHAHSQAFSMSEIRRHFIVPGGAESCNSLKSKDDADAVVSVRADTYLAAAARSLGVAFPNCSKYMHIPSIFMCM